MGWKWKCHFITFFLYFLCALISVTVHEGEILRLEKISRASMGVLYIFICVYSYICVYLYVYLFMYLLGVYLCLSSNSVPPSISKRITVSVHCKSFFSLIQLSKNHTILTLNNNITQYIYTTLLLHTISLKTKTSKKLALGSTATNSRAIFKLLLSKCFNTML